MAIMLKQISQKQIWIFGGLLGCVAVYLSIQFVIMPMYSGLKTAITETKEIRAQLDGMRAIVRKRAEIQKQLEQARKKIRKISTHIPLPVLGNYRLDMEKKIRASLYDTDALITKVSDNDIMDIYGSSSEFKVYRVRVIAESSCHDLIMLFYNIEMSHPWVSISDLNIRPQDDRPERHNVSFIVSWLIWANPEERPAFLLEPE